MKKAKRQDVSEWPVDGDAFYWVRSDTGDICESKWISNSQSCRFRANIGNVFRSRADAESAKMKQFGRVIDLEEALK